MDVGMPCHRWLEDRCLEGAEGGADQSATALDVVCWDFGFISFKEISGFFLQQVSATALNHKDYYNHGAPFTPLEPPRALLSWNIRQKPFLSAAAGEAASNHIQFNSIQFNSIQFNSILRFHGCCRGGGFN
jgi:hypothetical protein